MVAPGGPVAYYGRANSSAHAAHSRTEHMNDLIDNVSRILATPMPRRKALRLFGGALAAAVVAFAGNQSLSAACTGTQVMCGTKCCPKGCCTKTTCCAKNSFVCPDGTCSASKGGASGLCTTKCSG